MNLDVFGAGRHDNVAAQIFYICKVNVDPIENPKGKIDLGFPFNVVCIKGCFFYYNINHNQLNFFFQHKPH